MDSETKGEGGERQEEKAGDGLSSELGRLGIRQLAWMAVCCPKGKG